MFRTFLSTQASREKISTSRLDMKSCSSLDGKQQSVQRFEPQNSHYYDDDEYAAAAAAADDDDDDDELIQSQGQQRNHKDHTREKLELKFRLVS